MATMEDYVASLLRNFNAGTVTDSMLDNFQTNWEAGRFTPTQMAQLSGLASQEGLAFNSNEDNTGLYNPPSDQAQDWSVQGYLDYAGWTPDSPEQETRDIISNVQEWGLDGGNFGYDEQAIVDYLQNTLPQVEGTPIRNGMTSSGGQIYDTPTGDPNILPPAGNEGTDPTTQPGYAPDWDFGTSIRDTARPAPRGSGDWDWDQFGAPPLEGGGGYDPNDYAFDRYVPGQESPWGVPDVEGGNQDFYRNQFVNLLRQEQNFQNRQRDSYAQRQEAIENPLEIPELDWSWVEGGLPEVTEFGSGYAAPTAGFQVPEGWGYQQGGTARFMFNPTTGVWGPTNYATINGSQGA